jgi:hypothetical protein
LKRKVALKCEDARRLLADRGDADAAEHLERCAACFEALEAADPVVRLLVAARPAVAPAPPWLANMVLERWRPGRWRLRTVMTAGTAIAAVAVAVVVEALVGADPARLAALVFGLLGDASAWVGGALTAAQSAQSILLGVPAVLAALTAATAAACALWLKLVLSLPAWRSAS